MEKLHLKSISIFLILAFLFYSTSCQEEKKHKTVSIGFYNLENLFDTIYDAELLLNEEFTPESAKLWTAERYQQKLTNMAYVISNMATEITPEGLALLGVCEVENRGVLDDLVKEESIKDRNYQIVHFDSPDKRGIDVGLLYNPTYFEVKNTKTYTVILPDDSSFFTRDQLVVSGLFDGETIHIIVNHWSSRRGGEEESRPKRIAAGDLTRTIVDSLLILDQNANILVMGDLNDDPDDISIVEHLKAKATMEELKEGDLFNPMFQLHKDGLGTLSYRKKWNLFDMVIVSQGLLGESKSDYKFYKAEVFDRPYLRQTEGDYAGFPNRTYAGKYYLGGYSDHFPVYVYLKKEIK